MAGCAQGTDSASSTPSSLYLPGEVEGSALILFNRVTQRLVAYDPKSFTVTAESNVPNFLQYGFPTRSEYFTAGNSAGTDFRILRVSGGAVKTILKIPDGEGIFPLATDGDQRLFVHATYDGGHEKQRSLVSLEGQQLVRYPKVTGLVDSGAMLGGRLYYTTFIEKTDNFNLHVVPLGDKGAEPKLMASGLEAGGLYVHKGQLFTSTKDRLVHEQQSFRCVELCWFYDELGVLLRMRIGETAGLNLDIVDTKTQRTIASHSDVIDFSVEGSIVVIYRLGVIDRVETRPS